MTCVFMKSSGFMAGIGAGGIVCEGSTLRWAMRVCYGQDTMVSRWLGRRFVARFEPMPGEELIMTAIRLVRRSVARAAVASGSVSGPDRGSSCAGEFALRDGDTVVFLGDSITAARTYGKIIENYTLLRFPDRKVRFINAGWGATRRPAG